MKRQSIAGILAMLILAWLSCPLAAANLVEKMMMPGELSKAHVKLEEDCANCHKTLEKEAQSGLCADCHKDVKQDLAIGRGFHGKNIVVTKSECFTCHAEHLGRDKHLVDLVQVTFDHKLTEFPLAGRHAIASCGDCHLQGKKFREASSACFDCHKADDVHRAQLGENCSDCHSPAGWTRDVAAFDHGKTRFPLKGKHAQQPCISCHVGEVYKNLPMGCNDCHAIQDVHKGRFGAECDACHSLTTWKDAKFDHGKQTRFSLEGAHGKALCADCHGDNVKAKLSMACFDCHAPQDVHKAELGRDCASCHGAVSWLADVKFDHDLTDYPLTGLHAVAACEACHESKAYKGVTTACASCHAQDDEHEGRFASNCGSCHSPNGWLRVAFNHGRDTSFALSGVHAKTACYDCHKAKNVQDASLPTACISCHRRQDVHRGAFGMDCARCHTTATFSTAFIRK